MDYNYKNPIYNQYNTIDCEINHPEHGWIPFTASPDDCEEHGKKLFEKIKKNGNISPYLPPSKEEVELEVRYERNRLLSNSDWSQLPDVPEEIKLKWVEYRQLLRDITEQEGFPYDVKWPVEPQ
jgi:hypothetical protein